MDFKLTEEQKQIVATLDEIGKNVFAKKAARWDENHEYPSYEEFMKFIKENNFQFSKLKPWQMYGYDDETEETPHSRVH